MGAARRKQSQIVTVRFKLAVGALLASAAITVTAPLAHADQDSDYISILNSLGWPQHSFDAWPNDPHCCDAELIREAHHVCAQLAVGPLLVPDDVEFTTREDERIDIVDAAAKVYCPQYPLPQQYLPLYICGRHCEAPSTPEPLPKCWPNDCPHR
jgi:Protein of unknown function (DUF732)